MDIIRRYKKGSPEYTRLQLAADMMTMLDERGCKYWVGDTYFDFGQNWMWTTIIGEWKSKNLNDTYQALYPAQFERIILSDSVDEIKEVVEEVLERKYHYDSKQA